MLRLHVVCTLVRDPAGAQLQMRFQPTVLADVGHMVRGVSDSGGHGEKLSRRMHKRTGRLERFVRLDALSDCVIARLSVGGEGLGNSSTIHRSDVGVV
jgi:hypothetical protein